MDPYRSLSIELIRLAVEKKEFRSACRHLLISETQVQAWIKGRSQIRLSTWLLIQQKMGLHASELAKSIVAPQDFQNSRKWTTSPQMVKNVIAPLLQALRSGHTLTSVAQALSLAAHATYGHWEKGRREISLSAFLRVIDCLAHRLPVVCEMMGYRKELSAETFRSVPRPSDFSFKFFRYPWTPTVYLAIVTGALNPRSYKGKMADLRKLGISHEEIRLSLKILFDLRLVKIKGKEYQIQKDYFYAPASLDPQILKNLSQYWFSKSANLFDFQGLHKIDEVTVARESIPKINQWIGELREKIRNESKASEPETILHLHWQMADLFPQA